MIIIEMMMIKIMMIIMTMIIIGNIEEKGEEGQVKEKITEKIY